MELIRTLLRLMRALNEREVDYVLVGGAALNVHGLVRATRDILDQQDARALIEAFGPTEEDDGG